MQPASYSWLRDKSDPDARWLKRWNFFAASGSGVPFKYTSWVDCVIVESRYITFTPFLTDLMLVSGISVWMKQIRIPVFSVVNVCTVHAEQTEIGYLLLERNMPVGLPSAGNWVLLLVKLVLQFLSDHPTLLPLASLLPCVYWIRWRVCSDCLPFNLSMLPFLCVHLSYSCMF